MAQLVSIEKQNQYVIFRLSDESSVMYDLERDVTIGKKGDPVRGLNSQLRGIKLESVKPLFSDIGFYNYLCRLQTAKTYPSYTLSGVLSRVIEFPYLEGYVRLGINADPRISTPVSNVPKLLLKWIKDRGPNAPYLTTEYIDAWKANEAEAQAMLSVRDATNYKYVDLLVSSMITERGSTRSKYGKFHDLLETYRYDPATLARYIYQISYYEGLDILNATQLLRDYAMMQTQLSDGKHSFDKYPRNLLSVHHIVQRNVYRLRRSFDEEAFKATYDESLCASIGDYIFVCPSCSSQVKNEGVQQLHCVAAYIDDIIDGRCHIIFMRERRRPNKSYLTLEVVDNSVVQAKGFHNRDVTPEEAVVIERYNSYLRARKVAA